MISEKGVMQSPTTLGDKQGDPVMGKSFADMPESLEDTVGEMEGSLS